MHASASVLAAWLSTLRFAHLHVISLAGAETASPACMLIVFAQAAEINNLFKALLFVLSCLCSIAGPHSDWAALPCCFS